MKLISINVSLPKSVNYNNRNISTGIFNKPVSGRVMLYKDNLEGDRQSDLSNHGGLDKAVYAYPVEHYNYWREKLGIDDLPYGIIGENFTTSGLLEQNVCIGDILNIGDAQLQVTQGRVPCAKLAIRVDRPEFPKLFLESLKCGFYLRVLEIGMVEAGSDIKLIRHQGKRINIRDAFETLLITRNDQKFTQEILKIPELGEDWKNGYSRFV